jgi:hypothetical protein
MSLNIRDLATCGNTRHKHDHFYLWFSIKGCQGKYSTLRYMASLGIEKRVDVNAP